MLQNHNLVEEEDMVLVQIHLEVQEIQLFLHKEQEEEQVKDIQAKDLVEEEEVLHLLQMEQVEMVKDL